MTFYLKLGKKNSSVIVNLVLEVCILRENPFLAILS